MKLNTTTQLLKSCKLVFAGSYETVNMQTGRIKVTAKTFSCPITVTNLELADFLSAVNVTGPEPALQRPLLAVGVRFYRRLPAVRLI